MNETFTYWFFYKKEKGSPLYAYTDRKELKERFLLERNKKKFKLKKKKLTKEEIHILTEEYNEGYLEEFPFVTKFLHKEQYRVIKVSLVITKMERISISNLASSLIYQKIWEYIIYPPDLFQEKFLPALQFISYLEAYEYLYNDTYQNDDILYDFSPDYFGFFLDLYGDLMKG